MTEINIGDKVLVTNIDGYEANGEYAFGLFEIRGIGDVGIVVDISTKRTSWPVEVAFESGTFFHSYSELELVED